MIHIAVCDDEEYFCKREREIISDYMKKRNVSCVIDFFLSGREFLENGNTDRYQIVFLDVSMEGLDGIETAKIMRDFNREILAPAF